MSPFSRRRRNEPTGSGASGPASVPGGTTAEPTPGAADPAAQAAAAAEAAEFTERLGDLDRFIGGEPSARPAPAPMPTAVRADGPTRRVSPTMPAPGATAPATRNLPAAPIPAVAPISHPRPRTEPDANAVAEVEHDGEHHDEAAEFVERLGDLDRFIGGDAPTPPTAPPAPPVAQAATAAPGPAPAFAPSPAPVADHEDEAQEFLDRLGDLDRFIGGTGH